MRRCCVFALVLLFGPIHAADGQNLLVNGDFETGTGTGWTAWDGGWGSNDPPVFNDTEPGRNGNYCLRLHTSSQHSFGVYQEVSVTPGKTYRISAYWKGQHYGSSNWYEIMLLDGPWDPYQADSGPSGVVQSNFMYAYDNPDNPLTADFGWIWTSDQDGTPVDWNNRNGERTATGSVMTVVLKAGACCGTNGATAWFDDVSLVEVGEENGCGPLNCNTFVNGDFSQGLNQWEPWTVSGSPAISITPNDELSISGTGHDGGVYQQFHTGGPGTVVNVIGTWNSDPTAAGSMWGEVLVINGDRVPADGVGETHGTNNVVRMYRNGAIGGWDGPMPKTTLPQDVRVSFVADDSKATIILRSGNNGSGATNVRFENVRVHCVPPPATLGSPPPGFEVRTHTLPVTFMTNLAQSPVSRNLYAIRHDSNVANVRLYRINVDGPSITSTQIPITGTHTDMDYVQGMTFDHDGNLFISTQYGKLFKGTDMNPDPAIDDFHFVRLFDLPDFQLGTFHGVGGLAVGPDNRIYINSGSESHYGYLSNGSPEQFFDQFNQPLLNARILRCDLDGSNLEVFSEGIRNSFGLAFRSDGALFGVENGPNTNCHYAEEFNRIEQGRHYGFPYHMASNFTGGDNSITCNNPPGGNVDGPPPLPSGLVTTPGWANYGPNGKPNAGQPGDQTGWADVFYGFHPHSSPNGLDFYEPAKMDPQAIKFPSEFFGRAFVARFGQLESVPDVGRDVLTLRLDDENEGFITNTLLHSVGRAIDVVCAYNGKVYILGFDQSSTGMSWPPGTNSRIIEIAYTIPSCDPQILVSETGFQNSVHLYGAVTDETFTVTNVGGGTLDYEVTIEYQTSPSGWLDVDPAAGSLANVDPADLITVSYPGAPTLGVGVHEATIRVAADGVANSPQTISVMLNVNTVSPDFDGDGDVDMADFGFLQACFSTVSGNPPPAGCDPARLDNDLDVDQNDLNILLGCMSGAGILADPSCDDAWQ